jgi:hypothetical protein
MSSKYRLRQLLQYMNQQFPLMTCEFYATMVADSAVRNRLEIKYPFHA